MQNKEDLNTATVFVKNGTNKYTKLVIKIDWEITCFHVESRLKSYFRKNQIRTLEDFLWKYEFFKKDCPKKTILQLEAFKSVVDKIIDGPPYPKEVLRMVKKFTNGSRQRPTTAQKAFLYSLHFFEPLFNKCKKFKSFVNQEAIKLHLDKKLIYEYIGV
jgi:hypothetical protein